MKLKLLINKAGIKTALMLSAILCAILLISSCTVKKKVTESLSAKDSSAINVEESAKHEATKAEVVTSVDTSTTNESTTITKTETESKFEINPKTGSVYKASEKKTKTETKRTKETKNDKRQEKMVSETSDSTKHKTTETKQVTEIISTKNSEVDRQKWWVQPLIWAGIIIIIAFVVWRIYKWVKRKTPI